jgi:tRNA pseudouridine55 synthase
MNQAFKRKRVPVHGVLLLDKPVGITSTQALAAVKRLLNAEKAGHTGTLDPFATGLLPLCFGEATKFAQDLLEADKTYEATVHLGVTTSTGDTEGQVLATQPVDVSPAQIDTVLYSFRGPISQVPPMYSALKRDGKPLYEYAREGITLERDARDVVIHELTLLDYTAPELKIRVRCSKGTYIRVLGEDIGQALGCGAHLTALRRTALASLNIAQSQTLATLQTEGEIAHYLLPVDALLSTMARIDLSPILATRFLQGQRLSMVREGIVLPDEVREARIYHEDRLLGVADITLEGLLAPRRLVQLSS